MPLVLGAVYLGGWWLFALVAVAAALSLHEFWLMARVLAPLAPAGYIGATLALVGSTTLRRHLAAWWRTHDVRTRVSLEGDLRGAGCVDVGDQQHRDGCAVDRRRAWLPAASARPANAWSPGAVHALARRLGRRHVRLSRRTAARPAQDGAVDVARQDVGGVPLRHRRDGLRLVRGALQAALPDDSAVDRARRRCSRSRGHSATSSSRC